MKKEIKKEMDMEVLNRMTQLLRNGHLLKHVLAKVGFTKERVADYVLYRYKYYRLPKQIKDFYAGLFKEYNREKYEEKYKPIYEFIKSHPEMSYAEMAKQLNVNRYVIDSCVLALRKRGEIESRSTHNGITYEILKLLNKGYSNSQIMQITNLKQIKILKVKCLKKSLVHESVSLEGSIKLSSKYYIKLRAWYDEEVFGLDKFTNIVYTPVVVQGDRQWHKPCFATVNLILFHDSPRNIANFTLISKDILQYLNTFYTHKINRYVIAQRMRNWLLSLEKEITEKQNGSNDIEKV